MRKFVYRYVLVACALLTLLPGRASAQNCSDRWAAILADLNAFKAASCVVPDPPPPCTFTITPTGPLSFSSGGGSATVSVTASATTCAWAATTTSSWLTVSAGATGSGVSTVTAGANSGSARTATVTVAGIAVTVNQDAAPAPAPKPTTPTLTASPSSITAGASSTLSLVTPTNNYHNIFINGTRPSCTYNTTSVVCSMVVSPSVTTTYQSSSTDANNVPYTMPAVTVTVTAVPPPPPPPPPPADTLPTRLLQQADLLKVDTFGAPCCVSGTLANGTFLADEFSYANGAIAFNPARNSLFVVGHDWGQRVAELTIASGGAAGTLLQPFTDPLYGKMTTIDPDVAAGSEGGKVGGLLVQGSTLYISAHTYYDGAGNAKASHFTRSTNLLDANVVGALRVGDLNPGFYGNYLAAIPSEWQAALGGDVLAGGCCLAIIGRTSYGPDAFAVNSADLAAGVNPTSARPLVYYDTLHTTLGSWGGNGSPDPLFNMATHVKAAVIVPGTATALFFGDTGLGTPCYGAGTANQSLVGQPTPDGSVYCYDPINSAKGTHAYPYSAYVWAYDLHDFAKVRAGQLQPWDVTPYASWAHTGGSLGAAFDPVTNRIYLSGSTTSTATGPFAFDVYQVKP